MTRGRLCGILSICRKTWNPSVSLYPGRVFIKRGIALLKKIILAASIVIALSPVIGIEAKTPASSKGKQAPAPIVTITSSAPAAETVKAAPEKEAPVQVKITPAKAETKAETTEKEGKKKPAFEDKRIEINLASRLLTLYQGDVGIRMYPVAPGKPDSPTPVGRRKVVDMEINPTWIDPDHPEVEIPSGPDCPIGYRWIGIGGNYGIHGTNVPSAIGTYASHGCVRLNEKDVEDLYAHIVKGIPVDIIYERVVIHVQPDKTLTYYVYPDGYHREPLTVKDIENKLAPYGASAFVNEDQVREAIESSDGQPNYVAKVYDLYVKGTKLSDKALGKDGAVYIPVMPVANAAGVRAEWSPNWQQVRTKYGRAPGISKGGSLYVNANEAAALFGLKGTLEDNGTYVIQ